jgi:hypothetical protein
MWWFYNLIPPPPPFSSQRRGEQHRALNRSNAFSSLTGEEWPKAGQQCVPLSGRRGVAGGRGEVLSVTLTITPHHSDAARQAAHFRCVKVCRCARGKLLVAGSSQLKKSKVRVKTTISSAMCSPFDRNFKRFRATEYRATREQSQENRDAKTRKPTSLSLISGLMLSR